MSDPHTSPWTPTPSTTAPMLGQPAPTVGAEPDECPATGNGCHFGPHGPNGEKQCQYCGSPAPNPELKADGLLLDLAIANGCELTGTPDGGEAVKVVFTPAAWRAFANKIKAGDVSGHAYVSEYGADTEAFRRVTADAERRKVFNVFFPDGGWATVKDPASLAKKLVVDFSGPHGLGASEAHLKSHCKATKQFALFQPDGTLTYSPSGGEVFAGLATAEAAFVGASAVESVVFREVRDSMKERQRFAVFTACGDFHVCDSAADAIAELRAHDATEGVNPYAPLGTHTDKPKLHEYEIDAMLGDPTCLAALMRIEDLRYSEHSAVYGADAHVTWPTARYTELKERGRAIVAQDPEIWPDDILNAFGIPIPPKPPTESPYVQGLRFAVQQAERVAIDLEARRETSAEEAKSAALRSLKYAAPSKYAFRDTAMTCDGAASAYEVAANRARDAVKALKRALDLHSSY